MRKTMSYMDTTLSLTEYLEIKPKNLSGYAKLNQIGYRHNLDKKVVKEFVIRAMCEVFVKVPRMAHDAKRLATQLKGNSVSVASFNGNASQLAIACMRFQFNVIIDEMRWWYTNNSDVNWGRWCVACEKLAKILCEILHEHEEDSADDATEVVFDKVVSDASYVGYDVLMQSFHDAVTVLCNDGSSTEAALENLTETATNCSVSFAFA